MRLNPGILLQQLAQTAFLLKSPHGKLMDNGMSRLTAHTLAELHHHGLRKNQAVQAVKIPLHMRRIYMQMLDKTDCPLDGSMDKRANLRENRDFCRSPSGIAFVFEFQTLHQRSCTSANQACIRRKFHRTERIALMRHRRRTDTPLPLYFFHLTDL